MSRHRHVRKISYSDDYDDDYDCYGRSVEEEPNFSPSDESYMYHRDRHEGSLSSCMDNIDLNNAENISSGSNTKVSGNVDGNPVSPAVKIIRPSNKVTQGFDISCTKQGGKVTAGGSTGAKSLKNHQKTLNTNCKTDFKRNSSPSIEQSSSPRAKRNSSQPTEQNSPSVNENLNSTDRPSSTPKPTNISSVKKTSECLVKQPETKNKESTSENDASLIELKSEFGKENLNLIVVGHVDAGKSTLMGHLLYQLGCVSKKVIQKYEHESEKIGKQSFAFAWVLDEVEEERGRGITMDIGKSKFETSTKSVTLLDAPGHKDFIPNMISGATQADAALLVIDATVGEFETGFESGGQTREHTLLIRSLGVSQLVIVVNKMDNVSWSHQRFNEICQKLGSFLRQVGFKDSDLSYIPCSGLTGLNLTKKLSDSSMAWYEGPTLIDAIDKFSLPERPVNKPLRMCVHDIYKNVGTYNVSGRIETGYINVGTKVSVQPKNEVAVIKSLTVDEENRSAVFAGSYVNVVLANVDAENICVGHVLCEVQHPIPVSSKFEAKIVIFDIVYPLTKGYTMTLHLLSLVDPVVITKLNAQLNKVTGELIKKNPRCLTKNTAALVTIETSRPICLELYKDVREFGRFMLRDSGVTVAAGLVMKIF